MTSNTQRWIAGMSILVVLSALALTRPAQAQNQAEAKNFNVPAQSATTGITEFARQAGIQILVSEPLVRGKRTAAVTGSHTVPEALAILLKDSGLNAGSKDGMTYTLAATRPPPTSLNSPAPSGMSAASETGAQTPADPPSSLAGADQSRGGIEEIIVTAQKRSERLQDVPVPVTAISAETLVQQNALRLEDYYASVPGLSMSTTDFGWPLLAIRGLTTGGYTNPTVAVIVDDVPYGSSTAIANGEEVPDIDPSDLSRIEVLRGPQGTLYGASSLGGLLKYVTLDPSTDAVSGRVSAGLTSINNGTGLGYSVRGAINVPLSDTLAVRVSAFTRIDPGYIDNILTGQNGINRVDASGGMFSALWRPVENFSAKFTTLVQHDKAFGLSLVDLPTNGYVGPQLGDLQQTNVAGTGVSSKTLEAYALTLKGKIGSVDLTSVSGFNEKRYYDSDDFTDIFGSYTQQQFGVAGTPIEEFDDVRRFTEELRLSSSIGTSIDWILGGYFDHETSHYVEDLDAAVPATGRAVGNWAVYSIPNTYLEYAAFADVTYHFTDRFDVQIGGRESHNRQTLNETTSGVYDPVFLGVPSPVNYVQVNSSDSSGTYLLTPRFKVSDDLMVYARLASGYRPGGPNYNVPGAPLTYKPDTTQNYEIGVKGDALDHIFTFDASLYYIDWQNIQLYLVNPATGETFYANGGHAKSQGVELSIESRPLQGLTVSAWVTWDEAALTQAFPANTAAYGESGDRLPYSSRFSGNLSLEQQFPLSGQVTGFVGSTVSYVGNREGIFTGTAGDPAPRQEFPGYVKSDVRGGVKYGTWTFNLFANNVADRRGILAGGLGSNIPYAFQYIQPRTIGLSVAKTF